VHTLEHSLTWDQFDDIEVRCAQISNADSQLNDEQRSLLQKHLEVGAKIYRRVRSGVQLWKACEGKEVFRSIAKDIGFSDPHAAERAIIGTWEKEPKLVPDELKLVRDYVSGL